LKFQLFKQSLDFQSDAPHVIPLHSRDGIEIYAQFVGMLKVSGANWMWMQLNAPEVYDPRKAGSVVDDNFFSFSARRK
jgi:hypothetical protein